MRFFQHLRVVISTENYLQQKSKNQISHNCAMVCTLVGAKYKLVQVRRRFEYEKYTVYRSLFRCKRRTCMLQHVGPVQKKKNGPMK
jgi:hypothetical protein